MRSVDLKMYILKNKIVVLDRENGTNHFKLYMHHVKLKQADDFAEC